MLFSRRERLLVQRKNSVLNEIRSISVKSLDDQKKFLDTKFDKKVFKFSWSWFFKALLDFVIYFVLFFLFFRLFTFLNIEIPLWLAIPIIIFFPLLLNFIFKRFNIQKDDLSVFFK
jgi:hypothetical protein